MPETFNIRPVSADVHSLAQVAPINLMRQAQDREHSFLVELVRSKWELLSRTHGRVFLIGAGQHCQWLLPILLERISPRIVAILDDQAQETFSLHGISVIRPEAAKAEEADAVIVASDSIGDILKRRALAIFGQRIPILSFYDNLPVGPYARPQLHPAAAKIASAAPSSASNPRKPAPIQPALYIDPVGFCNLRCAMCPRGGFSRLRNARSGLMEMPVFKRIIDKVIADKADFGYIAFGNWGESLLHPQLPEMIQYINDRFGGKMQIALMSNLNHLPDPERLLRAGLTTLYISTSGMTQDIYEKNHIGGSVYRVLRNILTLVETRRALKLNTQLVLRFHDYIYNKADQVLGRLFCQTYGLRFKQVRPFICPVEECVRFQKEDLTPHYRQYIDVDEERNLMTTLRSGKCNIITHVAVDFDGSLYRCAGVYDDRYLMGSVFDFDMKTIPDVRSPICDICARTPVSFRKLADSHPA